MFEPQSSAYTYLVACDRTRKAALIDPVFETVERDLALLEELGLTLIVTLETHIHADHVTGAARLRDATGSRAVVPERSNAHHVDQPIREGEPIRVGDVAIGSQRRGATAMAGLRRRPAAGLRSNRR